MRSGTSVRFVWVPSHVGVFGNEAADRAAKAALHSGSGVDIPYTVSEIGGLVKRYVMSKWQNRWDLSTHGRFFFSIKKRVSRDMSCFGKTRRDQVIISRLRLGHCGLRARLHLIDRHPTGLCECGVPETVDHYLFGCFRHVAQRAVLFRALDAAQLSHNSMALDDSRAVPAFLDFVRTTGKYMSL
jgi:RNase H.